MTADRGSDAPSQRGVRMIGVGSAVPPRILTNRELESLMDTSDDWIVKRTGIHERHVVDPERGEGTLSLSTEAIQHALQDAGMTGRDLDLLIVATVTAEMTCPSTACRVAEAIGLGTSGSFDLVAACSGFVYALNVADTLIRSGRHQAIGIVGCDTMSTVVDYEDRSVSILFGDAAGAAVLTADPDPDRGCLYQTLRSDGGMWRTLYLPVHDRDILDDDRDNPIRLGNLRMNGREVYRFAVTRFQDVIVEALEQTGLTVDDVSQFICHQSNIRIIEAAKERLGLPDDKVYVNIDRYGNSSAGSVGLCLDELWRAGRVREGDAIVLVAFGGGLTWASCVWKV